jgi:hypothetical protein
VRAPPPPATCGPCPAAGAARTGGRIASAGAPTTQPPAVQIQVLRAIRAVAVICLTCTSLH